MAPQIFTENVSQAISKNKFYKEDGYTFFAWHYWDSQGNMIMHKDQEVITVTQDITLIANWAISIYTVTFDANGGVGEMQPLISAHNMTKQLTENAFTREGYTFLGWSTSPDGEKVYSDKEYITTTSDITLYAVWKPHTYYVFFNANGGIGTMQSQIFTRDVEQNLAENQFTREDYKFIGWATNADGEKEYDDQQSITVTSGMKLYAVWEPLPPPPYTITVEYGETYVNFGEWPQTVLPLNNTVTVDESISKTVGLFTYYAGSDDNWYVKQVENAVDTSSIDDPPKYSDGTTVNHGGTTTRYFKVEPIEWRMLEEKDGKKFLLAEKGLIALAYYDVYKSNRTIGTETIYANNYMHSKVRAWLNGYNYQKESENCADYQDKGFLQTAFTSEKQSLILTTTVDNSAEANGTLPSWTCSDTEDKVFLLSVAEVTNTNYGFSSSRSTTENDVNRIRIPTDFALATGASYVNNASFYGGSWLLRSPFHDGRGQTSQNITTNGRFVYGGSPIARTDTMVVPALWVE